MFDCRETMIRGQTAMRVYNTYTLARTPGEANTVYHQDILSFDSVHEHRKLLETDRRPFVVCMSR